MMLRIMHVQVVWSKHFHGQKGCPREQLQHKLRHLAPSKTMSCDMARMQVHVHLLTHDTAPSMHE